MLRIIVTSYADATLNERVFGLVLGQCSRMVRDHIEAAAGWEVINQYSDPMGLLALIRQSLFTGSTTPKRGSRFDQCGIGATQVQAVRPHDKSGVP
jgi:hypothetical protein